ncbi:hypothetical protein [Streptomyces halobius]|uniref:Uncharacterized protein n=1 Tax=Streptomyces halobius TaxID=2879846 RepID=A0ABY4M0X0_9ACTN|nr:hypothetical protein [Streptomyces halobius]UQA91067.1 hypothetical protein K9S39_03485 [Streptomyces halobius]
MVTAWSPSSMLRARSSAGPLRLLWLAALLLGVLFTHGVSVESAEGHTTAGITAPVYAAAVNHEGQTGEAGHGDDVAYTSPALVAADDRHDGEGSSHPAEECLSGQPHQGPDLAAPCLSPLDWAPPTHAQDVGKTGPSQPESAVLSTTGSRDSVVQQVQIPASLTGRRLS